MERKKCTVHQINASIIDFVQAQSHPYDFLIKTMTFLSKICTWMFYNIILPHTADKIPSSGYFR